MTFLLKKGWVRAIFLLIMSQIMIGFILIPFYSMGLISKENISIEAVGINLSILILLLQLIGNIILIYGFRKQYDKKTFTSLGLGLSDSKLDFSYGLIWGASLISIGIITLLLTNSTTMQFNDFSLVTLLSYSLFFLLVAINEELLIRGYVLNNLMKSVNKYIALVIASVLFMLMHASNDNFSIIPMINLFLAGLLLGIYYVHKRNIWFSIGLHFTWNFFQGPLFGFEVSGIKFSSVVTQNFNAEPVITGGNFGLEGSVIFTFILAISIIILHFKYSKKDLIAPYLNRNKDPSLI